MFILIVFLHISLFFSKMLMTLGSYSMWISLNTFRQETDNRTVNELARDILRKNEIK